MKTLVKQDGGRVNSVGRPSLLLRIRRCLEAFAIAKSALGIKIKTPRNGASSKKLLRITIG